MMTKEHKRVYNVNTEFEENYAWGKAPFYKNLAKGETLIMNNTPIFKEEYNLIVSKRDFGFYSIGMKPHRNWSFNETKKYYGLTGNKAKVAEDIKQLWEDYKEFKKKHVSYSEE
jgi:hypothetical protein